MVRRQNKTTASHCKNLHCKSLHCKKLHCKNSPCGKSLSPTHRLCLLLGFLVLPFFLSTHDSHAQRGKNRFNSLSSNSASSSKTGKGIVAQPLSPEAKKKFAKAQPEDITSKNFPQTIESFDYQNAEITDLIKAMGELTGKNFIIDGKVRGKVTIIAPSKITVAEAYKAFLSALAINGFTVVPSGPFLKVRQSRADANRDSIETYSGDYFPNSDQLITYIMQLKHISAAQVRKDIRILNSKDGEISAYEPTNSLIITDYGSNVERAVKILSRLDTPGFQDQMEVMPVKHAKAKDIAELIDQIVSKGTGKKSRSSRRGSFSSSRLRNNQAKSVNQPRFNVIPDGRTNSLIVVGNNSGIGRIRKLVKKLDFRLNPEDAGGVYVYYVKHGLAVEIEKTLQGITKDTKKKKTSSLLRARSFSPPSPTEQIFGGDVRIKADKQTNSLLVTSSKQDYQAVLNLLQKIDIPKDQVFVEAIIMEMSLDNSRSWGTGFYKFNKEGTGKVGFNTIKDFVSLLSPTSNTQGAVLGFGSGDIIEVAGTSISSTIGLVNFLKSNANTNVLSTPQIMTRDNEEGVIEVGDKVPIASETTTANNGSTTNSVKFEDATIKLKIKPFISPNRTKVRLEVDQRVQQLSNRQPPAGVTTVFLQAISKRSIKTQIEVNNKDTAVLGGLMSDRITESVSKVPVLGDIPILGWLFKSNVKTTTKVNLLVFITPTIIQNSDDNSKLLGDKLNQRIDFVKSTGGKDSFGKYIDRLPRQATLNDNDSDGEDDDENDSDKEDNDENDSEEVIEDE